MVDEQKLRQLAEAATPGPWSHWQSGGIHQIDAAKTTVVHWSGFDQLHTPNEKTAIKNNAAYIAAANPAAILSLLDELQTLREERTALLANEQNLQAAVKQARIDALEEAKQACDVSEPGWTGYECPNTFQDGVRACEVAIESLKEAP